MYTKGTNSAITVPEAFYFTKRTVKERFMNGERTLNELCTVNDLFILNV
jgi:hypothetical protein